jgi:hypothetical protein
MNRTLAGVHVEHDAVGAVETLGLPQRLPVQPVKGVADLPLPPKPYASVGATLF